MKKKKRTKQPPQKTTSDYRRLWRIIDGAVADAFFCHPEYLRGGFEKNARASINKRVVGALNGYAVETAKGRSGNTGG